jgi:hypothetical protein
MPLSKKDLSELAKEFQKTKEEQASAKATLPDLDNQVKEKEEQAKRIRIAYDNANLERVIPYQLEHRWLNGTNYTNITDQQISDAGNRVDGNLFFPNDWKFNNAKLSPSANGNPKNTLNDNEISNFNNTLELSGLSALISFILSGQNSSAASGVLQNSYSSGQNSIFVSSLFHTSNNLGLLSGSGTSSLVRITSFSPAPGEIPGSIVSIQEIIAPENTIANGSFVENFNGFSELERQNLTSSSYQNILIQISNRIKNSVNIWKTYLDNQLVELNKNIDAKSEVDNAKAILNSSLNAINNWIALPDTGATGKFLNANLNTLTQKISERTTFIPTRVSQITNALGLVSQNSNPKADYSGSGVYLQRFKSLNFLINSADGPLYQIYGLGQAKGNFEDKVANAADKTSTTSNIARYASFVENTSPTSVKVDNAKSFNVNDDVLITGNDLPPLEAKILQISSNVVSFDIEVPKEYSKESKSGIIKAI